MTDKLKELLPCPFCGDTPSEVSFVLSDGGYKYGAIQCSCGVIGSDVRTDHKDFPHWRDAAVEQWNTRAPLPAVEAAEIEVVAFQSRVQPWMMECFGPAIAADTIERNHRFLEEALELVQACECTADEAHKLVDYVYGRPVGERSQEVGGVMVTLAALCLAQGLDMHANAETELARITQPAMVERIREKQKRKPAMSPLPGSYPERLAGVNQQAGSGVLTEEMLLAGMEASLLGRPAIDDDRYVRAIYSAMINAAPLPPSPAAKAVANE